jgi:hypothetical protein
MTAAAVHGKTTSERARTHVEPEHGTCLSMGPPPLQKKRRRSDGRVVFTTEEEFVGGKRPAAA